MKKLEDVLTPEALDAIEEIKGPEHLEAIKGLVELLLMANEIAEKHDIGLGLYLYQGIISPEGVSVATCQVAYEQKDIMFPEVRIINDLIPVVLGEGEVREKMIAISNIISENVSIIQSLEHIPEFREVEKFETFREEEDS